MSGVTIGLISTGKSATDDVQTLLLLTALVGNANVHNDVAVHSLVTFDLGCIRKTSGPAVRARIRI
jgi:hypothetical protein